MCKYIVTYRVIGECNVEVDADDTIEAVKKADSKMLERDFNDLDEIEDFNPKYIENEFGKRVEEY